ncbi:MAG TPA: tRNA epoxyqueuosine(34) reductase QueG [Flavobacteriales bacterium]|nr:tRNA epoxyqueuosine(34) reductase QueG [Flavobacteriales bacterium]HIN38979.1 tRNA epoxyqueuosine(34) reductase QueG [Flavobacteriales bacterium]
MSATLTQQIKKKALSLGFSHIGISKAQFLEDDAPRLETWLKKGMHGNMAYMEHHFDKRLDPAKLVPGAKSVISLMLNYFTNASQVDQQAPKISKYAYGNDYHSVIKTKLKGLTSFIQDNVGEVNGRVFVDSAPVLDKAWAQKSGLGWVGKNGNLINKDAGSFFFLAEFISDLELEYDFPVANHCGTCTMCIDACPTGAIEEPYIVNGSKCISYLTIELKESIPIDFAGKMENWAFGCDICQDVCPWNRFSTAHKESEFEINNAILNMNLKDWEEITEDVFKNVFRNSPLKRAKHKGMKRNIEFLKKTAPQESA